LLPIQLNLSRSHGHIVAGRTKSIKIPVTPWGIESVTFRLVVYRLSQQQLL
jgi:hypothetical protein